MVVVAKAAAPKTSDYSCKYFGHSIRQNQIINLLQQTVQSTRFLAFIPIRSYGAQQLLTPFGNSRNELACCQQ